MDVAGMTLQAPEGHAGLGADVFAPQSLQGDGEDSRSGRNVSEFEHAQDLEASNHLPLLPTAPWGSQVCLHSWAEVSWPFKFYPRFPD